MISGFADGSFGPDNTLTRAEASTLIEISNGYDDTSDTTFSPDQAATRGEFAKMLYRALSRLH